MMKRHREKGEKVRGQSISCYTKDKTCGGLGGVGVSTPGDTEHGHEKNSDSNSLGFIQIPLRHISATESTSMGLIRSH